MADQLKPFSLNVVTVLYFKKPEDLLIKKDPKLAVRSSEAYTLGMLESIILRNNQRNPTRRPFLGFLKGSIGCEDEDWCTEAETLEYMGEKRCVSVPEEERNRHGRWAMSVTFIAIASIFWFISRRMKH